MSETLDHNVEPFTSRPAYRKWRGLRIAALGAVVALTPVLFLSGVVGGGDAASVQAANSSVPQTRTYFLGADEVVWNYAPAGVNQITGQPFDADAAVFVESGPQRIGSSYLKSLYREYTDASFSTLKPRSNADQHLGMLGPVIRGVVGDTIEVVFRNNLDRLASVHTYACSTRRAARGHHTTTAPRPATKRTMPCRRAAPAPIPMVCRSEPGRAGPHGR